MNRSDTEAPAAWWIYVCPSSGSPYTCGCELEDRWEGMDLIREDCQEREIRVVEKDAYDRVAAERNQLAAAVVRWADAPLPPKDATLADNKAYRDLERQMIEAAREALSGTGAQTSQTVAGDSRAVTPVPLESSHEGESDA